MRPLLWLALVATFVSPLVPAPSDAPLSYGALRWRSIGPFRGGRTVAASGIPDQPHLFYIAANNGGVWKTTDAGITWKPIFDDQPTGSIGALAIAPSDPDIIYVGSGEGLQRPDLSVGDGIYKTTDGGRTWAHLGLRDGQQISAIKVDPRNPDRLFVAVLGHPYGPNAERGVFRSTDGGRTFEKILYKDENTGAVDLAFDPRNADIVYAVLWAARQGPWENGAFQGPESGLFKSLDGGNTWRKMMNGLPTFEGGLGRIGIAVAPSDPNRLYALVDANGGGLYRSEDAAGSWTRVNNETRIWGRGSDFAEVKVDPVNPDTVYIANTSAYRSTDGGRSFRALKGAPGGDDYHTIWINPKHPEIILLAADQGATISLNRGESWSSWYNQPTAQFYHVITDNRFPYWVYGGQQESGSAAVVSRGDNGQITFRDWHPVGVEEYGYVAPDPLNPDIVYGGKATRFNSRTGEVQDISPVITRRGPRGAPAPYRFLRTAPILFSPVDPHVLYLAGNVLFKTINGGHSWDIISPDLSREKYEIPPSVGVFTEDAKKEATRRGVIYTVAPSPRDLNLIWAGTDDGLIHVTRDGGKTWRNVTPKGLEAWSKVSLMDAGHYDTATAYAAVNRIRCDDLRPHIYRTHDGGATWTEIVTGLPENEPVNVVREDPVRKGLLFAGTERAVHVSFDDGAHWQPLRLNMPATSIRDLVLHEGDVVVGTHGRGFWILDDMTPLRELAADSHVNAPRLFHPRAAYRVHDNRNTDTPLPPEEPAGQNPPDGAILYYWLDQALQTPLKLEIFDSTRRLVRRFTSADKPEVTPEQLARELTVMPEWTRPPQALGTAAGMHRFVWDLHDPPPPSARHDYPIAATWHNTPRHPLGPWVVPGTYTVTLTVDGKTFSQPLSVRMDPRVQVTPAVLDQQSKLSRRMVEIMSRTLGHPDPKVAALNGMAARLLGILQGSDTPPTAQALAAIADLEKQFAAASPKPLALHPANPHYFLFRGKPAVLVTSGEHYGAVLNLDFDYRRYLDTLAGSGFNLTRTFPGSYVETPGNFKIEGNTLAPQPDRFLAPWIRTGKGYDLTRYNPEFFERLHAFVKAASDRGIVVEMSLFTPMYEDSMWKVNPMNAANNVNGIGKLDRKAVFTLGDPALTRVQTDLVRKIVTELKGFDNLYYEVANEPYFGGITRAWHRHISKTIHDTETTLGVRHLIAENVANGSKKITDPDQFVSLFNFHYSRPPQSVEMNYGLDKPIGNNETGFDGVDIDVYRVQAWDFMIAGGALWNHLDYSFAVGHERGDFKFHDKQPGSGGPALRTQLAYLKESLEAMPLLKLKPVPVTEVTPAGTSVRSIGAPGEKYIAYIHHATATNQGGDHPSYSVTPGKYTASFALDLPAGRYKCTWIEPATRRPLTRESHIDHQAGPVRFDSPEHKLDLVLFIEREP